MPIELILLGYGLFCGAVGFGAGFAWSWVMYSTKTD